VEQTDLARIMAFTDGVMAVAITLLVLNIEVPNVPSDQLVSQLDNLLPSLGAYALSFALVGRFWVIHHRLFETLREFDGRLMAMNLAFLALIVLLPFSTALMDHYDTEPSAAAIFGATVGLASLTHWVMSNYTLRRGYVAEETLHIRLFAQPVGLGFAALFFASIPAAYLSTRLAQAIWLAAVVVRYPLRRAAARVSDTSS
jgi:uncharacterized membrane protein